MSIFIKFAEFISDLFFYMYYNGLWLIVWCIEFLVGKYKNILVLLKKNY